jgi:hypothetical protein
MSDKAVSKVEFAAATFGEGFNCSQAVLSALAPDLGLDRETALSLFSTPYQLNRRTALWVMPISLTRVHPLVLDEEVG